MEIKLSSPVPSVYRATVPVCLLRAVPGTLQVLPSVRCTGQDLLLRLTHSPACSGQLHPQDGELHEAFVFAVSMRGGPSSLGYTTTSLGLSVPPSPLDLYALGLAHRTPKKDSHMV